MEDRFNRAELFMNSIIVAIILLIIAIFFWPSSDRDLQSNKVDTSKTQIKVIVKRINIREEPTVNSSDIGDVHEGEIYTVLETVDKADFYWYKIATNNGITGYIASDPKSEYVIVLSGVIDRTPPVISCNKPFLLFFNGEVTYDDIECTDNYSSCNLTFDNTDSRYVKFIAKDDVGNESIFSVRYYNVYSTYKEFSEINDNLTAKFTQEIKDQKTLISASYTLNKLISKDDKSINYTPIITFFDENFTELKSINVKYNSYSLDDKCINTQDIKLKDEYLENDLKEGYSICINYSFAEDKRIKYFAVGFTGVENYNNDKNYFANYYSRYYIYSD